MKEQLDTLKQLVYILTGTTVEKGEDQYKDTEKQAEKLGITLQIRGTYPNDPANRLLTDRAIRECVTNCARHAHGTTVYVQLETTDKCLYIQITNDGDAPEKDAKEGRQVCLPSEKLWKQKNGSMKTIFEPVFCLHMQLPFKE